MATEASPTPAAAAVSTPAPAPAAPASTTAPAAAPVATAPAAAAPGTTPPAAAPPGTPEKPAEGKPVAPAEQPESLLKPPEKQDEKQANTEPGDQAKATPPAEVEVKVPDGVAVNAAILDELKGLAKDGKLTAQAAFDLGLKQQQAWAEELDKSLEKFKTDSIASLRKEWGAQFDANVVAAQKVVNRFGDPQLLAELNGLENSPALMRTLANIGRALGEDSIAIPGARSAPPPAPKRSVTGNALVDSLADGLYPSMRKD